MAVIIGNKEVAGTVNGLVVKRVSYADGQSEVNNGVDEFTSGISGETGAGETAAHETDMLKKKQPKKNRR